MSDDADFDQDDGDVNIELKDDRSVSRVPNGEDEVLGYSASARELLREQLRSEVEAFLASGGTIHEVPPNVVTHPPRKPQTNYGGQPI